MSLEAAFADLKGLGQCAHRKLPTELNQHCKAWAGISAAKMLNAFLVCHAAGAGHRFRRAAGAGRAAPGFRLRKTLAGPGLLTHSPTVQLETPRSRATSLWPRPPRTVATAFSLNCRSYR